MTPTTDWRSTSASEEGEYTFMLFQSDTQATSTASYQHTQHSDPLNQALSDEEMLDEIFQEIMSPQDSQSSTCDLEMTSTNTLLNPAHTPTSILAASESSAPSTPQLTSTLRRGSIPSASIGSISPNMAAALRVSTYPASQTGASRNTVFFPMVNDPKVRVNTSLSGYASMIFTSPTAAGRRGYRRTNRPIRLQKKEARLTHLSDARIDQGGGHCIAHGGGRRCSIGGCQKSAQSKGLCKLHGGARLCRLPDCNKNGQIKGLCRLHYSLTMAAKNSVSVKGAGTMSAVLKFEQYQNTQSPCDFELRV
ncbi:unnamed protein product [Peronospora farinosa]|uniref:WRKY19-like zinc finger domain-containing protein n=1 Tax=Peronospora farinosa TaxID=134698 RepID=A0AAV0T686_9STRA|nr:unnamed protein product [Peronospora farinosa]